MAIVRCQVVLQHSNGLPEDVTVNTFHVDMNGIDQASIDAVTADLTEFYTTDPDAGGGASALYTFMSTEVAQNGHLIKFYDMADAMPRVPLDENVFNLPAAPNGDPMPGEVALCLSFQGDKISGQPQARRRGRIFLGRLDKDCSAGGRPTDLLRTSLAAAGDKLLADSNASADYNWVVFSAAYDGMTTDVDGDVVPHPTREAYAESSTIVTNGWVDNAFDTQRRRGLAPTARTLFS